MEESRYKKEGVAYKLYWNETQVDEYTGPRRKNASRNS